MDIHIPDEALTEQMRSAQELIQELAVALYRDGKITSGHGLA